MINTDSINNTNTQIVDSKAGLLPLENNKVSFKSVITTWFIILFFYSKKMGLDDSVSAWRSVIFMVIILTLSLIIYYVSILLEIATKFGVGACFLSETQLPLISGISTYWLKVIVATFLNLLIWIETPILLKVIKRNPFEIFSKFFNYTDRISSNAIAKCFCYANAIVLFATLSQIFSYIIIPIHQFIVVCIIIYHNIKRKWVAFCYAVLLSGLSGLIYGILESFDFYE